MARGSGRKDRTSGTFGSVDKLATGYRARYYGPDGQRYQAPTLFQTKASARAWLSLRQCEIVRNAWMPPEAQQASARLTFADYAEGWLAQRELKPRTREHYRKLLDQHLLEAFGPTALTSITAESVRTWHVGIGARTPTLWSHAYSLLRTILATAVGDGALSANPCHIKGAGTTKRAISIRPLTVPELAKLTQAMPERQQGADPASVLVRAAVR